MTDTANRGTTLTTEQKRALLAQRLKEQLQQAKSFPLSFNQQRLWFLEQWLPGNPIYNMPMVARVEGPLHGEVLEKSLNEIVRRHASFCTTFATVQNQAVQVVSPARPWKLPVVDLTGLPAGEREGRARALVQEDARQGFDLARGPLFRASLIRVEPEVYYLLLNLHHIIADGWSMEVFLKELSALYRAFLHGEGSPLQDLPVTYADFTLWQRNRMQGDYLEQQLAFWRKELGGNLPVLQLPTDRPRPSVQSYRGAREHVLIAAELTEALKEVSRREGVTLFMTLLAAFQVLLFRHSGQDEVIVGTPIANRDQAQTEGLIGFFANTLAMRGNLAGAPSFRAYLRRIQETAIQAYAHQDLPFEKLVEALQPERALSHSPVFQVMFALQNASLQTLQLEGATISPVAIDWTDTGTSRFDLTLAIGEEGGALAGFVEYSTDLFDAPTIKRLIGHFHVLLTGIAADPEQSIATLPLLTEPERQELLVARNATAAEYPAHRCIHQLFEEQAERTPEATAVTFRDQSYSYRELNRRANQLARYLRSLGVGPEVLVGVSMERSLEMLVSLLAILKAGGAYVPLDPTYPGDRIAFVLQDSRVPVLLTQRRLAEGLPAAEAVRVVCVDDEAAVALERDENPGVSVDPANLAYVIYTSGSTGKPKGVQVCHRNVVNFFTGMDERIGCTEGDTLLAVTSISFDISVLELFWTLARGARILLLSEQAVTDGSLGEAASAHRPTMLQCTPSLARILAADANAMEALKSLRVWMLGGEALPPALARQLREALPARLVNMYGPTETTVWSATHEIAAVGESVPIGRPIANTELYILDGHLQPVPVGVAGELYIGGHGVTRGYLNRPELTRERFIPHPFRQDSGARLYKTGDLARYLPDGTVEFLGRTDHQVKIRGFRIELGEIETVLSSTGSVREAVVVAQSNGSGEQRLVGYVVPHAGQEPNPADLRSHLKQTLPEYMIPSAFVVLNAFPLTPNGKVDRKALPAPDAAAWEAGEHFEAPRTPVEAVVANVWGDFLHLERVSVTSNFFALGGHSLLAASLISRLREVFRVELPMRALFEEPTVAGLSRQIEAALRADGGRPVQTIAPVGRGAPLPLSLAQQRLWFLHQLEPESGAYNLPVAFRLSGALDCTVLERSLNEIGRRHEALRTTFAVVNDEPVQVIATTFALKLNVVDLSSLPEAEREAEALRWCNQEAWSPFDLGHGPLMRAGLLRLSGEEHILLLTLHHIITDGRSMEVLLQELAAIYQAFLREEPVPLADPTIHYADFAQWQRQWFDAEAAESQVRYWKEQVGGNPPPLDLPTDFPHPPAIDQRGAQEELILPESLTASLRALSGREGASLFMTLLAGLKLLLSRLSGQEEILVGTPIAGRSRLETESMLGLFINTLVLRTDLSGSPSFRELLARVRQTALGAYANQDVPFEKLVEVLQPERALNRNLFFDVLFNSTPSAALALGEASGVPYERFEPRSKFAMTFYVEEGPSQVQIRLVYQTALFKPERIRTMLDQYRSLLEQVAAAPGRPISTCSLVTAPAKAVLPDPALALDEPSYPLVTESVAEWVAKRPDHPAIRCNGTVWTYGQVYAGARRLAGALVARGLQRGDAVAVRGKRSGETIVSMLAVFLAGGVLVTLDPHLPPQRQQLMLEIAGAQYLLQTGDWHEADEWLTAELPAVAIMRVEPLLQGAEGGALPAGFDLPRLAADDAAYVFFTSGTTGVPKGVLGCHKGLSHFLTWQRETFGFGPADCCAQLTGLSFDVVLRDIFTPLTSGATLCLPDEMTELEPEKVVRWLQQQQVTSLHTVPALAATWLSNLPADLRVESVRQAFFAGEPLSGELVRRWRAVFPNAEVINLYGPTETTLAKCCYRVPAAVADGIQPVGSPLPHTQALVLGAGGELCGIGEPGEVVIRTPFRSLGYLANPEETQKRFYPNPARSDKHDLLYRTGDRGRYRLDGTLELLGRVDDQVKIRGVRVEPAEVAALLAEHPAVENCCVLAGKDPSGQYFLAAYLMLKEPGTPVSELKAHLSKRLPAVMLPAAFIVLEAMPLTANGKVDRRALPQPELAGQAPGQEYMAPRNDVEEVIAGIWAKVLAVSQLSIDSNFFDCGGHSLLASRVITRLREAFRYEIPLRLLFEAPTVAGMADALLHGPQGERVAKIARVLLKLARLSEEEVASLSRKEETSH